MAQQKRGLGRGLDALFIDNTTEVGAGSGSVQIKLSDISPNRGQPRTKFDEAALEELSQSIREHGVLQPIMVRPAADGTYTIVAGERRWRASRLAGLTLIPAVVRELSDEQAMEIALVENLQREDLDPIEEAEGYRALMERCGLTQEQAAAKVGRSRPAVANSLRLLQLSAPVREMLGGGRITIGHAKAILSLPDDRSREQAAEQIARDNLSVRDAEKLCTRSPKQQRISLPKTKEPEAREVEIALQNALGVEVEVQYKAGRGKLEVSFYSKEQLFDFANRLGGKQ